MRGRPLVKALLGVVKLLISFLFVFTLLVYSVMGPVESAVVAVLTLLLFGRGLFEDLGWPRRRAANGGR
jgi:hypothetical protein